MTDNVILPVFVKQDFFHILFMVRCDSLSNFRVCVFAQVH